MEELRIYGPFPRYPKMADKCEGKKKKEEEALPPLPRFTDKERLEAALHRQRPERNQNSPNDYDPDLVGIDLRPRKKQTSDSGNKQ